MNASTQSTASAAVPPPGRPPRTELIHKMLSDTKRAVVPIRRDFLQSPPNVFAPDGTRGSLLRAFARDVTTLDCYLWIAAMASASDPYFAEYPAATWAEAAGLARFSELDSAKTRWSKAVTRLVGLKLIERQRKGGKNQASYLLLREDGSGEPYTRPTTAEHGNWFTIPHNYWLDEWDLKLSAPEKLMLLIALDQRDGFDISPERVPDWYGLSRGTAQRGYKGLVDHGILDRETRYPVDPRSPTGRREVIYYTTVGVWSRAARRKAAKSRHVVSADDITAATAPEVAPQKAKTRRSEVRHGRIA